MTWLDNFLANPAIGITLQPKFPEATKFRDSVIGYLDHKYTDLTNSISFSAERPYDVKFETPHGLVYVIGPSTLVAEHKYVVKQTKQGGKLPSITPADLIPYSNLLKQVQSDIKDIFKLLAKNYGDQNVMRIGVMAKCSFNRSEMPPGLDLFLKHLSRPWPLGLSGLQSALTVNLLVEDKIKERCHHNVTFKENDDMITDEVSLNLDWQRLYIKPLLTKTIDDIVDDACVKSQEYFSKFGIGGLDYE